jgi:hypothetical protein
MLFTIEHSLHQDFGELSRVVAGNALALQFNACKILVMRRTGKQKKQDSPLISHRAVLCSMVICQNKEKIRADGDAVLRH